MLAPLRSRFLLATPLVLLPACGGEVGAAAAPFDAPADAASLVPGDAAALVGIESFDALSAMVEDGGGDPLELQALVGMLGRDVAVSAISRTEPILVAFRLQDDAPYPMPVVILPTTDAEALVASFAPQLSVVHHRAGDYVGAAPTGEGYAPGGAADPELPGGTLGARVELARLIDQFRPLVDTGLAQFEEQMSMVADMQTEQGGPGGMDLEPILEMYVDGARGFVDSADVLEFSIRRNGGRAELDLMLELLPGSPWDGLIDGEPVAVGEALDHVDGTAAIAVVGALDWAAFYEKVGPMIDSMLQAYPEALREPMARVFDASEVLYSDMSGPTAVSVDFGEGGMRMSGWSSSPDAEALLSEYVAALEPLRDAQVDVTLEGPTAVEINGRAASEVRLIYGPEFLDAVVGGEVDVETREMLEAMYGEEGAMDVRMAALGDEILWAFGSETLAAVAGGQPGAEPELAALVERVGPAPLVMAMRMDIERLFEGFQALLPTPPGDPENAPQIDMGPMLLYAAAEASRWRFGLSLDRAGLRRTIEAQED